MKQWHPVFAQLLRPAVEGYYEVLTTVPVGDAPREADFVLLRRTTQRPPPFHGLWRHLTAWSVLEFKGPSVSPRRDDLELLIELGLGIDRRLRHEGARQGQRHVEAPEVSFWYLANRLGKRFVREAAAKLGTLEALGPGLWRCQLLRRLLFLVSSVDLPVEEDSLPLHVVGKEPLALERRVARLVLDNPGLQMAYGGWLATLHPTAWKEIEAMARSTGKRLDFDIRPAIESLGLDRVIEQVGVNRVIEQVGVDRVIEQVGVNRVIEQVGVDHVIERVGDREITKRMGVERFFATLSPAELRQLKKLMQ